MECRNLIKYIKKCNFAKDKNWMSLIFHKIFQSISNKKISVSTVQIIDELNKLNSEYEFDLFKYI